MYVFDDLHTIFGKKKDKNNNFPIFAVSNSFFIIKGKKFRRPGLVISLGVFLWAVGKVRCLIRY
ncbi:hypothetical protein M2133_001690 [Parabacteroides sp. PF5-6]|nr:hypothetical protein [Parabacteroides sp. PF5-6]